MSLDTDEAEHSIEMHLPYIAKMMAPKRDQFTVVPVLVGSISADKEAKYGQIFAKYLADPTNLFIISSDFCHWGDRFHYTYYDQTKGEIHQSIKALDFAVSFTFFITRHRWRGLRNSLFVFVLVAAVVAQFLWSFRYTEFS